MGYFDALAGGSFKQIDGRWVFYPWGVVGRGYVIPTEQRYVEIRSWVKRSLQLWLPLVVVMGILVGWLYSFALLPVFSLWYWSRVRRLAQELEPATQAEQDRKSTRLNSSHQIISYAVFCLKKKKKK